MTLLELLTLSAASWYITYIAVNLPGPFGLFEKMREWRKGAWHGRPKSAVTYPDDNGKDIFERHKRGLFDCIFCLGFWVSIGLALLTGHTVLDGIAICGFMLWIHAYSSWVHIGGK